MRPTATCILGSVVRGRPTATRGPMAWSPVRATATHGPYATWSHSLCPLGNLRAGGSMTSTHRPRLQHDRRPPPNYLTAPDQSLIAARRPPPLPAATLSRCRPMRVAYLKPRTLRTHAPLAMADVQGRPLALLSFMSTLCARLLLVPLYMRPHFRRKTFTKLNLANLYVG